VTDKIWLVAINLQHWPRRTRVCLG
jgi:hypothetical protein